MIPATEAHFRSQLLQSWPSFVTEIVSLVSIVSHACIGLSDWTTYD